MKPRDWGSLGARLLSFYVAVQAIDIISSGLDQAFRSGAPIRDRFFAILPGPLFVTAAIFLWIRGPAVVTALLVSKDEKPRPAESSDAIRLALHAALVFAGLWLATTSVLAIVWNGLDVLWPPRPFPPLDVALPVGGSPPAPRPSDPQRRQSLVFLIANSAQFLAGLFLTFKAGSIARKLNRNA